MTKKSPLLLKEKGLEEKKTERKAGEARIFTHLFRSLFI